jgi:hypothetical protein
MIVVSYDEDDGNPGVGQRTKALDKEFLLGWRGVSRMIGVPAEKKGVDICVERPLHHRVKRALHIQQSRVQAGLRVALAVGLNPEVDVGRMQQLHNFEP